MQLATLLRNLRDRGYDPDDMDRLKRIVTAGKADYRRHNRARKSDSNRMQQPQPLDRLPALSADLKPSVPPFVPALQRYTQIAKEVWKDLDLHYRPSAQRDPWGPHSLAWDDAVQWIAAKHEPPKPEPPISISFEWPPRDVSQSPQPLGVGDLEEDLDED